MKRFVVSFVLIISVLFQGMAEESSNEAVSSTESARISRQYDLLHALYRELDQFYVDSLSPERVLGNAINGMMSSFDPYTNYLAEAETNELKFLTTGEYGGIGAVIGQRNGKVLILEPYENMPAQKAGLLPGDELLEINGVKLSSENATKASEMLKGVPGTLVTVVIRREGTPRTITRKIIRERIVINQVGYYGLVAPEVGYIGLSGFTDKASQEVRQAFLELKQAGAKRLILDLRNNGGGLLNEAVSICNLFLPKGEEIVSTRGKQHQWDQTYRTTSEPLDTVMPMVVLVNNGTASSSEIVGGALQDLDRAVILGTRTFGKGLVQTTRNLPYNSMLKVTTAKYYIPSGRCIQAIDYGQRNGNGRADRIPDSLTHAFSTRLGRIVRDGGGIQPDVVCQTEMDASICYDLMDGYYFFDYANEFRRKHASIDPIETFVLTDDIYQDFLRFVKARGFSYEKQSQKKLAELRQTIEDEALTGRVGSLLDSLETRLSNTLDEDFVTYRQEIELYLSTEIVNRYYYQRGELRQSLKYDPCLKKAIDLVENEDAYLTLLNRKKS